MRAILNIDDDIFNTAHYIAKQRNVSVGQVLSELAKIGLQTRPNFSLKHDSFPTFKVPNNATVIKPEHIKRLEDDAT